MAALAMLFGYPPASGVVASAVIRLANIAALAALALLLEADVLVRGRRRRST